jgi:diguanylate cyclase (GGDEF)-like protein
LANDHERLTNTVIVNNHNEVDDKLHAFLFVDIDDFKKVNDLYGHDEGDRLIISFAELIKSYFREDDINGRFGGDEFIVFVKNIKNIQTLNEIVERFCIKINEKNNENPEYEFTTSIGISIFPEHGNNTEDLIKNTDIALYESKDKGKNTYNIFKGKKEMHNN